MNPYRVVNVRGTNGSGKSTVALGVIGSAPMTKLGQENGYITAAGIQVMGKYITRCGGCDTIKTQALMIDCICSIIGDGPILFEGVIISNLFSTWYRTSQALRKIQRMNGAPDEGLVWTFLDTPMDVCLARVYERNGGKPIKEKNVTDKWKAVQSCKMKAAEIGENVYELDHTDPLPQVLELLACDELP